MKIQLKQGLTLTKESLSKLQDRQMSHVKGGKLFSSSGASCTCRDSSCKNNLDTIADL